MGKSSQRKGRAGEIELAALLREYGFDARPGRALNYGEEADVVGVPGLHCEVKRVERLNVGEAMLQAINDSERFQDGAPVLFHRRNRQPWLVTLRLTDFMQLYGAHGAQVATSGQSGQVGTDTPDNRTWSDAIGGGFDEA